MLPLLIVSLLAQPVSPAEPYGLAAYLSLATAYGTGQRGDAVRAIRAWPAPILRAAEVDLRNRRKQVRARAGSPDEIAFGTVEAAVVLHAEAGLAALAEQQLDEAALHLGASQSLLRWSRGVAVEARNRVEMQRSVGLGVDGLRGGHKIRERIQDRDYLLALATTALAVGSPNTARLIDRARAVAPLDPEVQLVYGCVAEAVAEQLAPGRQESRVDALRDQAALALMDALSLDDSRLEARLHLGRLHALRGRHVLAQQALLPFDVDAGDARQRYLARLFLGQLAEQRGRLADAAAFYRRALEAWPGSQSARLALAYVAEKTAGPEAALPLVADALARAEGGGAPDPWRAYLFGPPGLASSAFERLYDAVFPR